MKNCGMREYLLPKNLYSSTTGYVSALLFGTLQRARTMGWDKPFQLSLHHLLAVTLVRLLNLIKAQFPHLYNGSNNAYFLG